MRHPGFIQVIEAHSGDWWVVDDVRVIGVHLHSSDADPFSSAIEQGRAVSDNGCYAMYSIGTIPRCHAANLLLGESGQEDFADPGVMCRRAGWFDEDDESDDDD